MFNAIKKIKNKGYFPTIIFDIGSHHGKWTEECMKIYPQSTYHLFDGNDHEEINSLNVHSNVNLHKNVVLNEFIGQVNWYQNNSTGDSFYKERTIFFKDRSSIKKDCITLNEYVKQNISLTANDKILIKIDTQGSELNILKGSTEILNKTDFIILEVPVFGEYNQGAPKFIEYVNYMNDIGFVPYSIADNLTFKEFNIQTNIIFINQQHYFNKQIQDSMMDIVEETKKHTTVITYCSNYPYEVFERFTDTLYESGFTGNLIFIIKQADLKVLEKLMTTYKNVSYFIDINDNKRQCQQKRYFLYKEILASLKTERVLLTDCRDVFFQKNIELYKLNDNVDVAFAGEGKLISECPHNKNWLSIIEKDLKKDIIANIKNEAIICSGTTYGKLEGIKKYVNYMCELMSDPNLTDYPGLDQGIHNYLIYTNKISNFNYQILSSTNSFINTLQYGYKFIKNYNLVNHEGNVSYIVHQWDRLPDYMKSILNEKYKDKGYKF